MQKWGSAFPQEDLEFHIKDFYKMRIMCFAIDRSYVDQCCVGRSRLCMACSSEK